MVRGKTRYTEQGQRAEESKRIEQRKAIHTMLKAVLSTSLVSDGKLPTSSDTVAPSRAAFCVVQYMGISRILPSPNCN